MSKAEISAFMCDRCGSSINCRKEDETVFSLPPNWSRVEHEADFIEDETKNYDLCVECSTALVKFLSDG